MPRLFLIPNSISERGFDADPNAVSAIAHVRLFFVEGLKSARRLLKQLNPDFPLQECLFLDYNEHTTSAQIKEYVPLLKAQDSGIISESGCPCIADPGVDLVLAAHQHNMDIIPLIGPSSIVLALMASGLGGQNFAFNGYLSKDAKERAVKIKNLEKRAKQEGQTQIVMEAPYRNQNVMDDLLAHLDVKTLLCVALDITGKAQFIRTKTMQEWRNFNVPLPKKPALFIIK
ncbi:MAG: SAM-dependent methyltransferase [Candidatus Omnitrophica bacterium]|nr:SAM-dependent methyltransferase [Candidatus Omnitrophota bacterium]